MADLILKDCSYLGGCNYPAKVGDLIALSFGSECLLATFKDGASFTIPYIEIASLEVSGPGTVTSGGGFVGGGFGVSGALEGMAIAAVLNTITTKTKIHTILSIISNIGELHFHYGAMEPGALRISLASVHTALRRMNAAWTQERISAMKLAQSHGALSDADVARLVSRLTFPTLEGAVQPPVKVDPRTLPPPPVVGPKARCPNCGATTSLHAEECTACKAFFGHGSAWKLIPMK